jgi:DNA-binding transcriptional ArsR family regulator
MEKAITCIRAEADGRQIARLRKALSRQEERIQAQAERWSAAGNPVRASILFLLATDTCLCPCDLSDILGMSVPAVSQHLKRLREAELITGRRDGVMIHYSLTPHGAHIAQALHPSIRTRIPS